MDAPARVLWPTAARRLPARLALAAALAFGPAALSFGQMNPVDENSVKAAFTYNFAKFAEWPAELWAQPGKLRLCVAGGTGPLFVQALAGLEGKPPVQGKEIQIVQLTRREEARGCHMLVVGDEGRAGEAWLAAVQGLPVLTVSDAPQFVERGGMLGLVIDGERVRFEANLEPAQRGNLRLSSQLLKLARSVKGSPGAKP